MTEGKARLLMEVDSTEVTTGLLRQTWTVPSTMKVQQTPDTMVSKAHTSFPKILSLEIA